MDVGFKIPPPPPTISSKISCRELYLLISFSSFSSSSTIKNKNTSCFLSQLSLGLESSTSSPETTTNTEHQQQEMRAIMQIQILHGRRYNSSIQRWTKMTTSIQSQSGNLISALALDLTKGGKMGENIGASGLRHQVERELKGLLREDLRERRARIGEGWRGSRRERRQERGEKAMVVVMMMEVVMRGEFKSEERREAVHD